MPWDSIGAIIGSVAEGYVQMNARNQAAAASNQLALAAQQSSGYPSLEYYAYNQNNQNFDGIVTTMTRGAVPRSSFLDMIDSLGRAFSYGVKEITISRSDYITLHSNIGRYYNSSVSNRESDQLTISTSHGNIIVKCEGNTRFSNIDFDKYMEDVE
jgi:hypothetical protein